MSLSQLSQLLPLSHSHLQQVLDYAASLSNEEAAVHFEDLLGNSPEAIEFISTYNSQRQSSINSTDFQIPSTSRRKPKKKALLHALPPREVIHNPDISLQGTTYRKKDQDNYIVANQKLNSKRTSYDVPSFSKFQPRAPPSSAGPLISDFIKKSPKTQASNSKNLSKVKPPKTVHKTKVTISGGKPMHGASSALSELDAAIHSLQVSINNDPNSSNASKRKCNCIAKRHPLLAAAPNCLSCGKVICVLEGLGPCTFCGTPLLSPSELKLMITHLKEERGREKMQSDNKSQKRAVIASSHRPFSAPKEQISEINNKREQIMSAELQAKAHRDKLLNFQEQNTERTTVRDEVAEFNTNKSDVRKDMLWATPADRAKALKQQQKLLQEMEWNARPEYERKKVVVSLDVIDGKVIKRFESTERKPDELAVGKMAENDDSNDDNVPEEFSNENPAPKLSNNPLMGSLIRPVWTSKDSNNQKPSNENGRSDQQGTKTWRRVQDDQDDNEELVLDGGISR